MKLKGKKFIQLPENDFEYLELWHPVLFLRGEGASTPGIKDDMTNAGAKWIDKAVVIDGHLVSSRRPSDLPFYMPAFLKVAACL